MLKQNASAASLHDAISNVSIEAENSVQCTHSWLHCWAVDAVAGTYTAQQQTGFSAVWESIRGCCVVMKACMAGYTARTRKREGEDQRHLARPESPFYD